MNNQLSGHSDWAGRGISGSASILATLVAEFLRQKAAEGTKSARLFALRSLWAPSASARWVNFVHDYHRALACIEPAGIIINKPLRNYLARGLRPAQRVRLLIDHYEIASQLLPVSVRANLARDEILTLGILRGNRGEYALKLAGSRIMHTTHEGEIVLFMEKCSDGCILAKASFAFARQSDGSVDLVIGGLQGVLGGLKREVVDATRSLSALRPKDVVLIAVHALADQLGINRIHAVGNSRHVIRAHKAHKILADYDSYWMERRGNPSEPYGFTLPVALPKTKIPPNKREQHKTSVVSMVAGLLDTR